MLNFWITESPIDFSLVEFEKHYKHSIQWNFRDSEFDGQVVNQEEIVKAYIRSEILEKGK